MVRLDERVSPQAIRMEWRLSYCSGFAYETYRTPGRLRLEGRMDGADWKDTLSESVPDDLMRIAPDRHVGSGAIWGH